MAKIWLKKCPKCRGDLMRNGIDNVIQCLQCARILSQHEELTILGILPPPPKVETPLAPVKRGRPRKRAVAA